ncbi:ABC-three component system middle component 6 [Lactiplantibacillus plantarum]|uniref:ABC-three component system middle component 6 n=4 Tax=Lactiplantibacillus plantarum TaxID=1590 RepID=UPI000A5FDBE7|nr:ABC-three component system middle component 6 [Lactiplantibacillus plantarum]
MMLLVNKATRPENTIYHIAALINDVINNSCEGIDFSSLYKVIINKFYDKQQLNSTSYMLALDFLFLVNKINIDKEGKIYVSQKNENN